MNVATFIDEEMRRWWDHKRLHSVWYVQDRGHSTQEARDYGPETTLRDFVTEGLRKKENNRKCEKKDHVLQIGWPGRLD